MNCIYPLILRQVCYDTRTYYEERKREGEGKGGRGREKGRGREGKREGEREREGKRAYKTGNIIIIISGGLKF